MEPSAAPGARGRVTLIGTAHVFDLRDAIRREVLRRAPEVVALELDPARFAALAGGRKGDGRGMPLAYRFLARLQDRIARSFGTEAGDEMLAARDAAVLLGARLALVDMDARRVLARVGSSMGLRERARLVWSLVSGVFARPASLEKEVRRMRSDYASYMDALAREFPTLKRVLIDERNEHMAHALRGLADVHASIVAVLGDGHVDGVAELLARDGVPVESVRLVDLERAEQGMSAGFTVDVPWDGAPKGP